MKRAYSLLTVKSVDEDERIIEGIASTPTTDRMGDIVEPKGAVFKTPLPLLWQHRSNEPIGQVIAAKATDAGIEVRARIAKDLLPRIDEAWALIKSGLVRGLSIGFRPIESADIDGTWGQRFVKWEWLELSAVTIAANQEASIQTIKSIDAMQRRAALGTNADAGRDGSTRPGATGTSPKGTNVKTIEQRLSELQQQRAGFAARMKEIHDGCNGDFSSLNREDAKEYDELAGEIDVVDVEIRRSKAMQSAIGTAVEVTAETQEQGSRVRAGIPAEPKREIDPKMKGIAFAQQVRVQWLAKRNGVDPIRLAESMRGRIDPRVALALKTAVLAGTTSGSATAGNWGMELVNVAPVGDFYEFLQPTTILGKFGQGGVPALNQVPFRVPLVGVTDGGDGYWVGEGLQKPVTSFALERTQLDPLKVAALCVVTEELLLDSSPSADAFLRNALANALRRRQDADFIDPSNSGTPSIKPAAITNGVSPVAATGTGDAADVRADIRAAINAFTTANNPLTSGVWIMKAATAVSLSLMHNALGGREFPGIGMNGGTLEGLPVIVSEHVPGVTAGDYVVLLNADDVYYGDNGEIRVDTSQHASIEMSTNPGGESGTVSSMFQENKVAFRAEKRVDWMRRRSTGVYVISGVNWGEV